MGRKLITTLALAGLASLLLAAAAGAKLKPVGKLRASKAGVSSLTIAWKDRSKGEKGFEVRVEAPDDSVTVRKVGANAERAKVKGLAAGTQYGFSVLVCGKRGGASRSACIARHRGARRRGLGKVRHDA